MKNKLIKKRKPKKCPECGSNTIATILYGYPAFDSELEKDIAEGRVSLGGCCQESSDPAWQCSGCETPFYREMGIDEGS